MASGSSGAATGGATVGGQVGVGGVVQAGGSVGAGGAPLEPTGKNIWFARGVLRLGETRFEEHLAALLDKAPRPSSRYPEGLLISGAEDPKQVQDSRLASRGETAADALSDQEVLAIFGCGTAEAACSADSLSLFVQRAWHGQGSALELAELVTELGELPEGGELPGLRAMLRTILASPKAYALKQLGQRTGSGGYHLDARERANLLAYGTGSLPVDDELSQAAESGALLETDELLAQAERLLQNPAGQRAFSDIVSGWFRIRTASELEALSREPRADVPSGASMLEETQSFIQYLLTKNAPVSELLSADYTFVGPAMAAFYGLPARGNELAHVNLSGTPRRGILHHASWLASNSHGYAPSYPARAISVLGVVCETPPPPPPGIVVTPPEPVQGLSRRERMEADTANPVCSSCHRVLDPLAFSFDHFDGVGRYQETENGLALDTSGSVRTFSGREFVFDSSTTLALQLAADPALARCYAATLAGAWVGSTSRDAAATDYALRWDFAARDKGLRAAILAWVESPYFFTRAE